MSAARNAQLLAGELRKFIVPPFPLALCFGPEKIGSLCDSARIESGASTRARKSARLARSLLARLQCSALQLALH